MKMRNKILSSMLCAAMMAAALLPGTGLTEVKAEEEKEVVTLFHHIGEEAARETLEKLIAGFEEANEGITIEEQGIDFSQYDTMLKTKLAGGDAPDLIMGRPKMYADLIRAGHIEPLTNEEFIKNVNRLPWNP